MNVDRQRSRTIESLFAEALFIAPTDRKGWLRERCGDDATLYAELAELLACDEGGFAALEAAVRETQSASRDPERFPLIAGFKIHRRIGSGGMGSVFAAEQAHPQREVALKVLSPLMLGTADAKRRFVHESQVLARLSHEGIARILQAGFCDEPEEAPYYAMELIKGTSLLQHAEQNALDLRARITLLIRILEAVQHAHQRGVIHRDLKPSNILVTVEGDPKILDFGIARDIDRPEAGTLITSTGQVLGTLGYMSPEQANGQSDIDTRTDVYALGVIMYELLAGEPPHDLRGKGFTEAVRMLENEEPLALGKRRHELRGDLETIAGKALSKERDRRYESAGAFAADLRSYLKHQPIAARPPSTWYLARKFSKRHRTLVTALSAAAVALLAGSVLALNFAWRASQAAEFAEHAAELANAEAQRADRERDRAQQEARTSERFVYFIIQTFQGIDPGKALGREPSLREAFDSMRNRMESNLKEEPWLRGRLFGFLGSMYESLGEPQVALELLQQSVAIYDELKNDRSYALEARLDLAMRLRRERRVEEALPIALDALERSSAKADHRDLTHANALMSVGEILIGLERPADALPYLSESLDLRRQIFGDEENEEMAVVLLVLGQAQQALEDYDQAEAHLVACLAMRRRIYREPHPLVAESLHVLGHIAWIKERYEEAQSMLEEAVRQRSLTMPADHPVHINGLSSLATIAEARGLWQASLDHLDRATALMLNAWGSKHPMLRDLSMKATRMLLRLERPSEAEARIRSVLEEMENEARAGHAPPEMDRAMELLAVALQMQELWVESDAQLRRGLEFVRADSSPTPGMEQRLLQRLVVVLEAQGRIEEAAATQLELKAKQEPGG